MIYVFFLTTSCMGDVWREQYLTIVQYNRIEHIKNKKGKYIPNNN